MHLCILGGGIIGFNTALHLQEQFSNARFTLIAEKFEEDTTSFRAAGIFRPGPAFSGPTPQITQNWIRDSYVYYDGILQSDSAPAAGVSQISGYIYASQYQSLTRNSLLEGVVPIYREATEEELNLCPGPWKYGSFFTTLLIESKNFLPWAKQRFETNGGKILKGRIENFDDLDKISLHSGQKFDGVFNCTGLGSKWLCNDAQVIPIRGQVLKVKAPWIKMCFYGDSKTYVVPGSSTITLGGCRQFDNYDTSVSKLDSTGIWERCISLVPSLQKGRIESEMVGLRPYRPIVRCELEEIGCHGNRLKVIHNYGHGGYGVTSAPGTAKFAVQLFQDSLKRSNEHWNHQSTCSARLSKL